MQKNYQSPEAIETERLIRSFWARRRDNLFDEPTLSFVRTSRVLLMLSE